MRHPPSIARSLPLIGLLAALLGSPAMAHAAPDHRSFSSETGAFYARMLEEHDGVFVEEELAGLLDRHAAVDDLRVLLDEYHVTVDVVVMASRGKYFAASDLASAVHEHSGRPLLVLPVDSLHIGHADLGSVGIPVSAVEYAGLTGGWYELPGDRLERVLRVSEEPDVGELAEQAWAQVESRTDVEASETGRVADESPRAVLAWREYGWVSFAGGTVGVLLAYAAVAAALRWYWHGRPARREEDR
ncbi:hypothetical protein A6A08_07615 [Nocardiopsis sp. TSRI0078]|uniref:hypothetical protein n=1 Tax=unclassified Nocardiopsis TaxID=2649073 RepID=UPI00093EF018|nr:hypothetical protein [Nocardiopsis sp. TSRI0078]OKI17114.1 hypothetical protein A6A08_07615 [Nocardiopsis sp. TSRI0078]